MVSLEHVDTLRRLWRGLPMTITLNHTIVPARDKRAAAQFFARIFRLHADPKAAISGRYVSTTRSRSFSMTSRSSRATTTRSTSAMPSSIPSSAAFARRSSLMAAHRGASTTVSSMTGTAAAPSMSGRPSSSYNSSFRSRRKAVASSSSHRSRRGPWLGRSPLTRRQKAPSTRW